VELDPSDKEESEGDYEPGYDDEEAELSDEEDTDQSLWHAKLDALGGL
jgi:hypothetical protein